MSSFSEVFPAGRIKRQPAQVRVIRNNGDAYGRIVLADGTNFDVFTNKDWYDDEDCVAAAAFVRAAKRGKLEPPIRWSEPFYEGINDDGESCVTREY